MSSVWLVQSGVPLDILDMQNKTALDYARENKRTAVDIWLTKKDAPSSINSSKEFQISLPKRMSIKWVQPNTNKSRVPMRPTNLNLRSNVKERSSTRNQDTSMWSILVASPQETLKVVTDPEWTVGQTIKQYNKKFPFSSDYVLFMETVDNFILLNEEVTIKSIVISIAGNFVFRENTFSGTAIKPLIKQKNSKSKNNSSNRFESVTTLRRRI